MHFQSNTGATAVKLVLWLLTFAAFTTAIVLASHYDQSDSFAANPHRWIALAMIVLGTILALTLRGIAKREAQGIGTPEGVQSESVDLEATRSTLIERSRHIHTGLSDSATEDSKRHITDLLHNQIDAIVEQRAALTERFGIGPFSSFLSDISRGERNLNRAWSALTDNRIEDARSALSAATTAFEDAVLPSA